MSTKNKNYQIVCNKIHFSKEGTVWKDFTLHSKWEMENITWIFITHGVQRTLDEWSQSGRGGVICYFDYLQLHPGVSASHYSGQDIK